MVIRVRTTTGCWTCRIRRVKCDEGKPQCQRCIKAKRTCDGYQPRPKQTQPRCPTDSSATALTLRASREELPTIGFLRHQCRVQQPEDELARAFFFFYFITLGHHTSEVSGPFDLIPGALMADSPNSPLSLALTAISMRVWTVWLNPTTEPSQEKIGRYLGPALRRLQASIDCPVESKRPGTVLAALTLQIDETLSAIFNNHRSVKIHHEGALALAQLQVVNSPSELLGKLLVYNSFQSEVSCSLIQKTAVSEPLVHAVRQVHIQDQSVVSSIDMIGVSVANCQARLLKAQEIAPSGPWPVEVCHKIEEEAKAVLKELAAWENSVPEGMRPCLLKKVRSTSPPIATYSGVSLVYPTVNIAGLWNTWRCRYLTLLNVLIAVSHKKHHGSFSDSKADAQAKCSCTAARLIYEKEVQRLVDDICNSIPFFMGNLQGPVDRTVLAGVPMEFPSYHDLYPDNPDGPPPSRAFGLASRELHARHALAQGPWKMVMALAYLLPLFASRSNCLSPVIRSGQAEWLLQQFRRVAIVSKFCGLRSEACSYMERLGAEQDVLSMVHDLRDRMRYSSCI